MNDVTRRLMKSVSRKNLNISRRHYQVDYNTIGTDTYALNGRKLVKSLVPYSVLVGAVAGRWVGRMSARPV